MPTKYNHQKFYTNPKDRKNMGKFDIKSGMIINFPYKGNSDKRPLVFVMDTDEYAMGDKKSFSGINLNYLSSADINRFFVKLSKLVGWEIDIRTQLPKVDLWEEEDTGTKPIKIYNSIVKKDLLKRKDCWRTYKYDKVKIVEMVNFQFKVEPLKSLIGKILDSKYKTNDILLEEKKEQQKNIGGVWKRIDGTWAGKNGSGMIQGYTSEIDARKWASDEV